MSRPWTPCLNPQCVGGKDGKAWWCMDRALLRALGERARGSEPETARQLLRAAHVALLGESDPDERERAQLLTRERDLAGSAGDTAARDRAESALVWARRAGPH